jgi:hypothetical protein
MTQNRDQKQTLVNGIINFYIPYNSENSFTTQQLLPSKEKLFSMHAITQVVTWRL